MRESSDFSADGRLTTAQMRIWMGQQLHPESPLYNMIHTFDTDGRIDPDHFLDAVQDVVRSSDALRTVIEVDGGIPRRKELQDVELAIPVIDFSDTLDPEDAASKWTEDFGELPIELSEPPLKVALLLLGPTRSRWVLVQHHIATDIRSTAEVSRRIVRAYESSLDGERAVRPPENDTPYAAFARYERELADSNRMSQAVEFWRNRGEASRGVPALYGRKPPMSSTGTRREQLNLGRERSERLREIAELPGFKSLTPDLSLFTLFATLLVAFQHRVSGQDRVVLGSPVHNRARKEFKRTIGLLMEVYPLEVDVQPGDSFASLGKMVQREAFNLFRHAVPGASAAAANRSYNVVLNFLHASFPTRMADMDMSTRWIHSRHGDSGHDVRLQVHDLNSEGMFTLLFDVNEDAFDHGARSRLVAHFEQLLNACLKDPDDPIRNAELVTSEERSQLLDAGGLPTSSVASAWDVVDRFHHVVSSSPGRTAVTGETGDLTYSELDRYSGRLASMLSELEVRAGDRVLIAMNRSPGAIVAILAVLKAGAAYVPVDPMYPAVRIQHIVADSGATVAVVDDEGARAVGSSGLQCIRVAAENHGNAPFNGPSERGNENDRAQNETAYIIYTSGSTGRPKGVEIGREALAFYVDRAASEYASSGPVTFAFFTPLAVDLTVTSVFVPLMTGGTIRVFGDEGHPAALVDQVVSDASVDIVKMTPSHFALIQASLDKTGRPVTVIYGGEQLTTSVARRTIARFGSDTVVYNEYGPTECTVGCVIHRFDPDGDTNEFVPIGRPIPGAGALVVDGMGNLVPIDIPGELVLSGPMLADGYHGLDEITRRSFVDHPIIQGERCYMTGDRVRWIDRDGAPVLEYLGRVDDQVKIRGARVELGEIQHALEEHPDVSAAVAAVINLGPPDGDVTHCTRCGLTSRYPGISFDAQGVCHLCRAYSEYERRAERYFGTMDDLRSIFRQTTGHLGSEAYDCLALLSGGKDSTYALGRLVDEGYRVLAFTLDNGFISDQAKANIRRVTKALGVDHRFGSTPAMNEIFVDSLNRFSNVCNGCFKTIYTLAINLAEEENIPIIVTGLSRGQFFETRLTEELFADANVDGDRVDEVVLTARKAYHQVDDAVHRLLDVSVFDDEDVFDRIRFVDFYRYCDVSLDEMMTYLDERLPWVRPSDTGRSTNCLINDAGIFVHKKERGYHNYAFPYSWDVRVGHKNRAEALDELDDDINEDTVRAMLREIGYEGEAMEKDSDRTALAVYYVARDQLSRAQLVAHLEERLPSYMVPSRFIPLDVLPLNPTGKVDRAALPSVAEVRSNDRSGFVPPDSPVEKHLATVWKELLRVDRVGRMDNFMDLGGTSLLAIQMLARANRDYGIDLTIQSAFDAPSIKDLAIRIEACLIEQIEALSEEEAQRLADR